ncbi:MAG: hypothetical protein ACREE3_00995 [Stellaceae bacterium]
MKLTIAAILAAFLIAPPALAANQIRCSDIPRAEAFLKKLQPGPNTRRAWDHLREAKRAHNNHRCVEQLGAVNYFAKRSLAADRRMGHRY